MERATACSHIADLDLQCVWHPFTPALRKAPVVFTHGKGALLYSEDQKSYIDATSSWWVNLHGHGNAYIAQAIANQASILEHVMFNDCSHAPAVLYAEKLLSFLPHGFSKVFYSDNGSTAVETALKMALQYFFNQNIKRTKILSFTHSYHGDTFGAMSAAGRNNFNRPFWSFLFEVKTITPPIEGQEELSLQELKKELLQDDVACLIYEPLIQGAGGMLLHNKRALERILSLCKESGVLLIADEVMTGFGRTLSLFASMQLDTLPDILCLAKGITGGFLPLAATVCQNHIFEAFYSEDKQKMLLHGHSYTANPIACAAALASIELLTSQDCLKQRQKISEKHKEFVSKYKGHPSLQRIESIGTILIVEHKTSLASSYFSPLRDKLFSYFLDHHILIRPLGNVLYVMPPYCTTEEQLDTIYGHIKHTLTW